MHELAVTRNVLDIAITKAAEAGASRVRSVKLVIGEISSVVDDSVQFYFDFLSRSTIAAGAVLSFTRIALKLRCRACGQEYSPGQGPWVCPGCGKWDAEVAAGQELYVDSIEVE